MNEFHESIDGETMDASLMERSDPAMTRGASGMCRTAHAFVDESS